MLVTFAWPAAVVTAVTVIVTLWRLLIHAAPALFSVSVSGRVVPMGTTTCPVPTMIAFDFLVAVLAWRIGAAYPLPLTATAQV